MSEPFKFLCSACGREFTEDEGGIQCPLCQSVYCINCMDKNAVRRVEVKPNAKTESERFQYMCVLCRQHWIHTRVLYDPSKDSADGLKVLKNLLDNGHTPCNVCRLYLDKRVQCWKRYFPEGCNQWSLSPKITDSFRTHGLIDKVLPKYAASDEQAVIKQIEHNISYWKTGIAKRETVEKYCREKGIPIPNVIIDNLIRKGIVYTPKPDYVGLTEVDKHLNDGTPKSLIKNIHHAFNGDVKP